jgi:tetratricopeptide (TPR) repeat protein
LAYSNLGLYEESLKSFTEASEKKPTDTLYWTIAHTYYQLKQYTNSQRYLQQAIELTEDWDLEQRCRFLLGEIFQINEEYHLAEQEYNAILNKNSASADAHFYLGELYLAQGQREKARAEWREAFKLDNYHFGANQRLFN